MKNFLSYTTECISESKYKFVLFLPKDRSITYFISLEQSENWISVYAHEENCHDDRHVCEDCDIEDFLSDYGSLCLSEGSAVDFFEEFIVYHLPMIPF